jgi:hypothetical protein
MPSLIVAIRWTEPCPGEDAAVAALSEAEAAELHEAADWLEGKAGQDWGDTIPRADLHPTGASGGDHLTLKGAMSYLAAACRYDSGEGIYEEDCPAFVRCGIERS